jgi:uroporphyrinogen-III decarboxylase
MFEPEKYRDRIEESKKRLEVARQFREPDRVPISISASGSYYCWLFGVNIRDYYLDIDLQIDVQSKGLEWRFETLQDDSTGYGLHTDHGPLGEALLWDTPIERPDGTSPWGVRIVHALEDIDRLPVPDPAQSKGVKWAYDRYEQMKEKVERRGLKLGVGGGLGIHPPLSCACALAPPDLVYEWMVTAPDKIRVFFDKCFEAFSRLVDFNDRYFGVKEHTHLGLADDNSAFVSADMYRRMVLPYNKALYERYGREGRYLHADGPNDHLFEIYANEIKLTQMDIGGFSDIAKAKPVLHGKVVMSGGLNCKDLYGDFAHAKPAIDRAIRIGAPGGGFILAIGGETYVGVNPDTLVKAVAYAKEAGRYPISI